MSTQNTNGDLGLSNTDIAPIRSKHSKSHTVSKTRSNEEQKKMNGDKESHSSDLTQFTMNASPKDRSKMKRKRVDDNELPFKMMKKKDETIPIFNIINLADDSHSNNGSHNSSNESSDVDSNDSNSNDDLLLFPLKKLKIGKQLTKEMFMENAERIYEVYAAKKRNESKRREKRKKRHKCRQVHSTMIDNQSKLANETELKREHVEESESKRELPIWVNPPSPPLKIVNSANASVQLSNVNNQIDSSNCNVEASAIENVDIKRCSSSLRRYDEMDNGDLDHLEETMDFVLPSSEELNSQNSMDSNDYRSRLNVQITSQSKVQMTNSTEIQQYIKYELDISEDEDFSYSSYNDSTNVPLLETIKPEPVNEDPKMTNLELDPVAFNKDETINAALNDCTSAIIKHEPHEGEPMAENSNFDVITLSDGDEYDNEHLADLCCNMEIKNEQLQDNHTEILGGCNELPKCSIVSDSSDDDVGYYESLENNLIDTNRKLSSKSEETKEQVRDAYFEEDTQDFPGKDILEVSCLLSDDTNNVGKNTISMQKHKIKSEHRETDEEIEKTDDEAICKDLHKNRSHEDTATTDKFNRKVQSTGNKYRDEKEFGNKTKSRNKQISHYETKAYDKETSRGNRRSVDEKLSCYKKKSSNEKIKHDEQRSQVENRSREEKKSYDDQSCKHEKRFHQQKRSKDEKISRSVQEELLDKVAESEDDSLKKSEYKAKSHKGDVVKQQHPSETKPARITISNKDNLTENSAVDLRLMPNGFPVVVLTKLNNPINSPSLVEPHILATDERNITKIDKHFNKQEAPTASASITGSVKSNERNIPSKKEPTDTTSKSTTKPNGDLMLKCKKETKHRLKEDKQRHKSSDSVSLRKKKVAPLTGEALKEVIKKIVFKEAEKRIVMKTEKISEFKPSVELLTAKLEVKMTVEADTRFLIKEQENNVMNGQYKEHENVIKCSEEQIGRSKSVDLVKETVVNKEEYSVHWNPKEKTEKEKTSYLDSKESSADGKTSSATRNNISKVKLKARKSLDLDTETPPNAGNSAEGIFVEKTLSTKTDFPYDIERKPMASFVGRIPKKSATQHILRKNPMLPNNYKHHFADWSDTHPEVSSMDEQGRRKKIWKSVVSMVKDARKHKSSGAPRRPRLSNNAKNKRARPKLEQFLQRIFQWNPIWLKENRCAAQKVVDIGNFTPMQPIYESYEDYYNDAARLLALDVWHRMMIEKEIMAMRARPCVMFSIVSRSVNLTKVSSTNIELTTLLLNVVISKREALTQAHPLIGDLMYLEYFLNWQGTELFTKDEAFAYVTDVRSNIISTNIQFNRDLLNFTKDPHTLLTYTVNMKPIHHSEIKTNKVCQMTTIPCFRPKTRSILALHHLLDSPLLNKIIHPKVEDYQLSPVRNLENYPLVTEDNLNAKQLEAVAKITETVVQRISKICLVEGPPGTGKTKVIANLLTQIIHGGGRYLKKPPFRILICAPSNAAVDEIVKRLLEQRRMFQKGQRFKMVRVGRPDTMHQNVKEVSLTELATKEVHRTIEAFRSFSVEKTQTVKRFHENRIKELEYERSNAKSADARKPIMRKIEDIRTIYNLLTNPRTADELDRKEMDALRKAAENTILEGAHVIACTLVSCCSSNMEAIFAHGDSNAISVCIVDEATQSSEADTLLPLLLGVKTLVLVGDNHQLPPAILSNNTKLGGLDQSLFARVQLAFAGQSINPTIQFDTQYRMSHPVAYWPNKFFYTGALYSVANLSPLPLHCYKVINLDSTQDEGVKPVTTNMREGLFVACLVYTLVTRAGLNDLKAPIRIGVITPYKRQKLLIEERIEDRFSRLSTKVKQKIILDVNTIDGFQGQERDVVIISCVRSNGIGFLSDRQRLCLALTRAKHSLILCGNFQTFQSDFMWNELLSDAQFRGAYVNVTWKASADEIKTHVVR